MKRKIMFLGLALFAILGCANGLTVLAALGYANNLTMLAELGGEAFAESEGGTSEGEALTSLADQIYIKAVNPGYVIDEKNNVGEMIEIARKDSSDTPILLAGTTVGYTNSSGNYSVLIEFPENSWMIGENILLRLASSPENELANLNYTKTLAFKGGIEIKQGDDVIDSVCWTGKEGCLAEFKSSNPTVLVRDLATGEFAHRAEYVPTYAAENYKVETSQEEAGYGGGGQCVNVKFTEVLSYYESSKKEQFIELYNGGTETVALEGCQIRYKNKNYALSGVLQPDGYMAYYPEGFSLTKNPTNQNKIELVDLAGAVMDTLIYYNGQRKSTSYAFIGYDGAGEEIWKTTYAPTPGAPNNYQEYKTCETGKVLNMETGNCVKATSVTEKVCAEGQYLNPLTGRCKKYSTSSTGTKTCKEGYYLNEETGRCRKIKENSGADYDLKAENYEESSSFVALYAILGVVGVGLIYAGYEFRHEIRKLFDKVFRRSR